MPKSLRPVLISILFVAGVAPFHAQTPAANADGYPAAGQPTAITLISPGAEPRTALRYHVTGSYKAHMDMDMTMGMSMNLPGLPEQSVEVPTMKLGAEV